MTGFDPLAVTTLGLWAAMALGEIYLVCSLVTYRTAKLVSYKYP